MSLHTHILTPHFKYKDIKNKKMEIYTRQISTNIKWGQLY